MIDKKIAEKIEELEKIESSLDEIATDEATLRNLEKGFLLLQNVTDLILEQLKAKNSPSGSMLAMSNDLLSEVAEIKKNSIEFMKTLE